MFKWFFSGGAIPLMLTACAICLTVYLRGFPFRTPKKMLAALLSQKEAGGDTSPFRALTLALAGTLGVGNIVGVANAIRIGGAGAVFWMWISALLAMVLKYSEILLAVAHRRSDGKRFFGGAYYYIKDHFLSRKMPRTATLLSVIFALLILLNAIGMGCIVQVNAISAATHGILGLSPGLCAVLLALFAMPVIIRGHKGISALTELLVPLMSAGYLILSVAVLILRRELVGNALASIVTDAFDAKSMSGGLLGFLTSRAIRVGTMRGLLSNEAGCGTAPTAHASAAATSPAAQGVWGIVEVFVDTIVLCTATALVILVGVPSPDLFGENAVMLTVSAFSTVLGSWAAWFLCGAILAFGYATLLCWAGYGLEALTFLSKRRGWKYLYFLLTLVAIVIGAVAAPESIWALTDFAITALTCINLVMLLLMRRTIKRETLLFCKDVPSKTTKKGTRTLT